MDETQKERYTYGQSSGYHEHPSASNGKQDEGARAPKRLWPVILAVAITAVVIGAAIGGGLGSQLHQSNHPYVQRVQTLCDLG